MTTEPHRFDDPNREVLGLAPAWAGAGVVEPERPKRRRKAADAGVADPSEVALTGESGPELVTPPAEDAQVTEEPPTS